MKCQTQTEHTLPYPLTDRLWNLTDKVFHQLHRDTAAKLEHRIPHSWTRLGHHVTSLKRAKRKNRKTKNATLTMTEKRKGEERIQSASMMADDQIAVWVFFGRDALCHMSACHCLPPCSHETLRLLIQDHCALKCTLPLKERRKQSALNIWYLSGKNCLLFFLSSADKILELLQYFPPIFCPNTL